MSISRMSRKLMPELKSLSHPNAKINDIAHTRSSTAYILRLALARRIPTHPCEILHEYVADKEANNSHV